MILEDNFKIGLLKQQLLKRRMTGENPILLNSIEEKIKYIENKMKN